ncbi:f-box domain-containing protein [Colletotrichum karsti]|uniref:F-box domain-containing protein n=1 Tax=Colletotrichum karsti TaxID=1095194 RepID=A0A9P6IEL5_9PEZI|nr:f-box domain-containing protein [Colletotrichum karsti]KAF9882068.1 f-box domain-containing protein [Colletotrichum karsti]
MVKIRDSITTAIPYSVALVAFADDFVYTSGMLCYTVGRESLRLLDLHKSADTEIVIDTRVLLQSVPEQNFGNSNYKFRPIHYADGIVSCLYIPPRTEGRSHLLVIDIGTRQLLTCHRLESHQKLFVRNDGDHLYYGTHSLVGDDGFKRWVLKRFSILDKKWGPGHLDLEDLVGSDIGATVCFEIIDGYFYGLSSLTSFEVYETDWTSIYYGFRFPVGSSCPRDMELTSKKDMWRRQQNEGPIDDRWSTLGLEKDPATGKFMVVECRREYLVDDCSSTRTSYRTELEFSNEDEDNLEEEGDAQARTHPSSLTHRGDSGSTTPSITLTHCFIRSYNKSCETFIDLVNDPIAAESMAQRPQLRSISRLRQGEISQRQGESLTNTTNNISWWLPENNAQQRNAKLDELDYILNPRGKSQQNVISGVMDDRSIVYAVGPRSSQSKRPLVFISFDPSIKLRGLDHWPGGPRTAPVPSGDHKKTEANPTPQSIPASAPAVSTPGPSKLGADPISETGKPELPAWGTAPAMYSEMRTLGTPSGFDFAYHGS